jgi:predicted Zn finger-like uncharacterized protein
MKIKCEICKTEYNIDNLSNPTVRCAICGNVWNVAVSPRKNSFLMFIAATCALLSAIVFTVAVIAHHQSARAQRGPLIASVSDVRTTTDDSGAVRVVVSGSIENVSDSIYGVPDLLIISSDDNGRVLARQKFMPSATLLDAGTSVNFSHVLSAQPAGVKKISAKLIGFDSENKGKR